MDHMQRDASPLTILLLGLIFSAFLFKIIVRFLKSIETRTEAKFRRLTREEEEEEVKRLAQRREEIVNEDNSEGEVDDHDDVGEEEEVPIAQFPAPTANKMTKKDIRKFEKKKKKEEEKLSQRAFLQHDEDLRNLRAREAEKRLQHEKDLFEAKQREVKDLKKLAWKSEVGDEHAVMLDFLSSQKETPLVQLQRRFPNFNHLDRFLAKSNAKRLCFLRTPRNSVVKIEEEDLRRLRDFVVRKGQASSEELMDELLMPT